MPRAVEYPRRSLSDALKLAETVSSLGGKCSVETCAESMKRKVSGAFAALVNAAVKYGLVTSKSGELAVTEQFNRYRLAYDEEEKRELLRQAFLNVPLFSQVFTQFRNGELPPGDILTKILIREFEVNENLASALYLYFIEGATESGLLSEDGKFVESDVAERDGEQTPVHDEAGHQEHAPQPIATSVAADGEFSITIAGPGLNSTLAIREPEDLLIVDAMLKKVQRKLEAAGTQRPPHQAISSDDQVQTEANYEE